MICFKKGSLFCCAVSSDVSVSDFSARSMADAVSAGSSSRSLVQVAEQAYPLLQRHRRANRMRERRNNRGHGEVRLPKRVVSRELKNAGKRVLRGKEKERMDCVAENRRLFGITGDWSTTALDPGVWYSTVREGGYSCMVAWVKEEENAF